MIRRYLLPLLLLIAIGAVLLFLPEKESNDEINPEKLLLNITSPSRFLSTDYVAEKLIEGDPAMVLVDVRYPDQYEYYSLPGAVNIPIDEILSEEWQEYFRTPGISFVLFSNGTVMADQAWILCERKKQDEIFVMEGGLNKWFETIFLAEPPPLTASGREIDLYTFRRGVSQFLTGGAAVAIPEADAEAVTVTRKTKKRAAEGGC